VLSCSVVVRLGKQLPLISFGSSSSVLLLQALKAYCRSRFTICLYHLVVERLARCVLRTSCLLSFDLFETLDQLIYQLVLVVEELAQTVPNGLLIGPHSVVLVVLRSGETGHDHVVLAPSLIVFATFFRHSFSILRLHFVENSRGEMKGWMVFDFLAIH
jgi:hypothetical protein